MFFSGAVIVVEDMKKSRKFYEEVLSQKLMFDFGECITFQGGTTLIQKGTWLGFIHRKPEQVLNRSDNFELYFEEEEMDAFLEKLSTYSEIEYIHEVVEFPWGQRVIRFYDPDQHVIEVGEAMKTVIRRFLRQGLTIEQTAERSQHPLEFVEACIEESFESDYCITYYRPDAAAVFLKWKKFCCGIDYRQPLNYALDLLRKYSCTNFIGDTRNGFEDTKEDIDWAFGEFIPAMSDTSCKNIIFIVSEVSDIEGEIDAFTKEFQKYFKVHKCTSIEEALKIKN